MDLMDHSISSFSVADNGVADNNLNGIENAGTPSKIQKCQKCACLLASFDPFIFRFWAISITILVIRECCNPPLTF